MGTCDVLRRGSQENHIRMKGKQHRQRKGMSKDVVSGVVSP